MLNFKILHLHEGRKIMPLMRENTIQVLSAVWNYINMSYSNQLVGVNGLSNKILEQKCPETKKHGRCFQWCSLFSLCKKLNTKYRLP